MAFQPAPNIVQCTFNYVIDSQKTVNSWNFHYAQPPTQSTTLVLAQYMRDNFWNGGLRNALSNQAILSNITATDLSSQTGPQSIVYPTPGTEVGAKASNAAPNNVAIVVTNLSTTRSRNGRGRQYIGGLPLSQIPNSIALTNQEITEILLAFTKLLDALGVIGAQLVILSRYLNKGTRLNAIGIPVIGFKCDTALDSQRRRLAGRGT